MNQEQYQWLKDNGYDPAVYDVDDQGNVFENPVAVAEPRKKVMSPLRAGLTSFAGSVLPSAAGLGGAKLGMMAGAPFGPVGIGLGAIGGGLGAGYLAGKGQEAVLENYAPEAIAEMQRAQTDQPVASYVGGFAPNAMAFRPSLQGLRGLAAPAMSMERDAMRAAFTPAAVNVGANVAASTAGQLVNMSEGGEFSAPRFASDVALGTLFNRPTALGRRMGFPDLAPETAAPERLDLAARRGQLTAPETFAESLEARMGTTADKVASEQYFIDGRRKTEAAVDKDYINWWRSEVPATKDVIRDVGKQYKIKLSQERLQQLADDPIGLEIAKGDYSNWPEFIAKRAEDALNESYEKTSVYDAWKRREESLRPGTGESVKNFEQFERGVFPREDVPANLPGDVMEASPEYLAQAMGAGRERTAALAPEGGVRVAPEGWEPKVARPTRAAVTTEEILGRLSEARENVSLEEALKPTPEEASKAEKIQAENARIEAEQNAAELQKLQDLEAAQALSDEAAARLQALQARQAELLRLANRAPAVIRRGVAEQGAPDIAQAKQELADARAIAEDLYSRLQRSGGEGRITQADLDAAAQLAARRGLKMQFTTPEQQAKGVRGVYLTNEAGERVIYIDALAATPDTAIHEIGHDVFARSPNERMRGSLMQTAENSPAYKAEFEARMNTLDKNGKPKYTEQQAHDIALEEGVVDSFAKAHPNVPPGEIRQWFNALKASLKSMMGMRLSPEDAAAWMHYATTEAVPWKGAVAVKGGEERMQRAQQETPEFKNWFGQSQVVDEQGKPLVVYHGTSAPDFTSFRTKTGYNYGPGAYFTPEPVRAAEYAETRTGSRVYPSYVSLKKPYIVTSDASVQDIGYKIRKDPANTELLNKLMDKYDARNSDILGNGEIGNAWLREQGYDGIIKQRNRYTEDGFVPEIVEVVAFNPEQVKSALGNRGTFSPESSDIRYQRSLLSEPENVLAKERYQRNILDKTLPEIEQITRRGGIYETVGRALTRLYNTARSMTGRANALAVEISKLNDKSAEKLTRHLLQEYRTRTFITPDADIAAAYSEWRNKVKRFWVDENNAAGNTIRQGTGLRERLSDDFWLPFHKESAEARQILSERVGTPEYQKLKDDYIREATDDYLSKGMNQQAAQEKARVDFEQERSVILAPFDPAAPATFAGARKPQGRPLPESWGELNFRNLLDSYNKRSGKDYASQLALERSPEVMAALGSQKMHNDQPIPSNVLQSTPNISTDPSVQSILREFSGRPLQAPGKAVRNVNSFASALALQTVSRIGDLGGTVTKPFAFVGLGDYGAYMAGMMDKLSKWGQVELRSIESGLNNPNAHQNFRQVLSVGEDAGNFMRKTLDFIGSVTGSNWIEKQARTLAQAQGELIVSLNKRRASTGDKEAVSFLDRLNPDWRTQSDTDLAGQFGLLMQGSYDMQQLPAWFLEGGAAPYLSWSKWSMGQLNNFRKFAVEPAMQGNLKPLVAQVLLGMAGGGAIEQIQEWLNNKESKAINWDELQSWAEQNQGQLGQNGAELLMQKLLMMAQKTGTFGFAGDLALLPVNALVGDTQGVVGAYPALDLVTDLAKNLGGALGAIDKGEDVGLVMKRFGKNVIVGKTQMFRVISNWADEIQNEGAENLRSADRRKQRLFDELNGMSRAGMFPVSYDNLGEQEFERGEITPETGEEAMSLVTRAREQATTPEDYASRIRKLKTSQNAIMPSLERQPMKAARYLSWMEGTEEGRGAETMRRYMIREQENKYRKSLIEGLSGLR